MKFIYPIMIVVLSTIITLTALKYSIKYLSVVTEYMLYRHVGGGTDYLITDYNINPISECIVLLSIIDKYQQPYHKDGTTDIRVCYRTTDMSIYWIQKYEDRLGDNLEMTFRYGEGSLSGLKFK